jgi:hypothetical protein
VRACRQSLFQNASRSPVSCGPGTSSWNWTRESNGSIRRSRKQNEGYDNFTLRAKTCLENHDYRQVPRLLDDADKLQRHNARLIRIIERTEEKLAKVLDDVVEKFGEGKNE